MADFLLEIGCEEIPARMIDDASNALAVGIHGALREHDLLGEELDPLRKLPKVESFSTPRRLAVLVRSIRNTQPDLTETLTGPSVKVAFRDGTPTPAAEAFAKKVGLPVQQLQKVSTPKGEYLQATTLRKGRRATEILAEALGEQIISIYWPKTMYWRRKSAERFVRPIRWILAVVDDQVVPFSLAGVSAGRTTRGHSILSPREIEIDQPVQYESKLRDANVIASRGFRESQIWTMLIQALKAFDEGLRLRENGQLLRKVTNLTEFPSAIVGRFDPVFLHLPEIILETVMREHQNYFSVEYSGTKKLAPNFLAILNTDGDPQGIIRHGHERVLRARFNDARFFWQTDQKHPLRERTEWLKHVTFQKDLGSYHEKALRVQRLASWLSEIIRQSGLQIRPGVIHKAAYLAKTDLTTELVKEFTELQGIVGGLYARVQPLDSDMPESTRFAIADAIYDHYKPASMEDSVPRTIEGAVLSIADKADSIAGMFALGLIPSGSKDPFALRRQANGIVKIIAEYKLPVQLSQLFFDAREAYRGSEAEKKFSAKIDFAGAVRDFFRERLEFYLRDVLGFKYDVVNAVLAAGSDDVVDAVARAKAVTKVRGLPDFESVAAAFKRINNILRQAREKGFSADGAFQYFQDAEHEEKLLMAKAEKLKSRFEKAVQEKDYADALIQLSTLRPDIDTFFDKVMVMVEDERIRKNRLELLQTLLKEFSTIADFSEIVTEGKSL
jgi:glycyl-tRNA synthetase beta chain